MPLLLLIFTGCNEQQSGSFFEDPPDCYYDSLFGCGTFDIPSNSSYYGYSYYRSLTNTSARLRTTSGKNYSGNWKAVMSKKSSSCSFKTPAKINGNFQIKQKKDSIQIKVPLSPGRAVSLRGKLSSNSIQATGRGFASLCSYSISSKLDPSGTRSAKIDLRLRVRCLIQKSCDLFYSGQAAR